MFEEEVRELQNDMVAACDEYAKGMADKVFISVCYEGLLNVDFFYAINGKIYDRAKINNAGLDIEFDVSGSAQEKVLVILIENTKK